MYKEIIEKKKLELEKSIEHFKEELGQLRTGRAATTMVDNLMVDYYGAKSPLKQVASITIPESRTIMISPWDKDSLVSIEKSIRESQLNLNPNNDGQVIRINIPALNEDRRKDLVKMLNQKAEDARISIRKHRENVWEEIQESEKAGLMGEDDKFAGKDELQKVVDEYNKKVEEIRAKKEEEILTV
ncbi:MAG: Ribosome-recycling factor [Candidatus Moranbacteria bacterium GW2011_GWA2_39_41]|nr:MAG: Ribosome-recycling factor [Candidatus Moranbacteria bacterium GW2011_GWA2_39_41]